MKATQPNKPARRVDMYGVILMLIGLISGAYAYWLIQYQDVNALVIVPAVIAATLGASSLTKLKPPETSSAL